MGAAKNIWGTVTGLFSKPKAETKVVKAAVKTLDSNTIKTTSKTLGSADKLVSGGESTLKTSVSKFAKGVGSTANVGGKVFGVTGILGGASLAGASIYGYVADEWAMTTAQREYENQIKLAGQEADVTKTARDNYLDYLKKIAEMRNNGDSSGMGASGGAGSDLFPMGSAASDTASANADSSKVMWLVILGVAGLGAGTYIYSKSRGKK
jgi:hypothetical protein